MCQVLKLSTTSACKLRKYLRPLVTNIELSAVAALGATTGMNLVIQGQGHLKPYLQRVRDPPGPARDLGHELEPRRRDRGGAGLSMQSRTNYSYESIQCAPGHVVSGGQWGTIV